jgi:Neuraminidase (sialidase)
LSPASQNGKVQGSQVATAPNGDVYVTYQSVVVGGNQMFFTKSTDGGTTWITPVACTPVFTEVNFTSSYRKDSFPSLAVGPMNGEIYNVYPDQPGANSEIKFVRSTDGGTTWSAPVVLNDVSTGQRLMPSVSADDQGGVHVCWFDTRNGADAQTYDIYATRGSLSAGVIA